MDDASILGSLAELIEILETMGRTPSLEAPSMSELDHGLQCAAELARWAPDELALQAAGLVHDIGDRLAGPGGHEARGEAALRGVLGARVARAVGLHVAAKRYLVTTDGAYRVLLSPGSIHTLSLQGGDMSEAEVRAFEAEPQAKDALLLRRADEAAKTPGRSVPGLDTWLPTLRTLAVSAASAP